MALLSRTFATIVCRTDLITDREVPAAVDGQLALKLPRWPSMTRGRLAGQVDKIVGCADVDAVRRRIQRRADRAVLMPKVGRSALPGRRVERDCESGEDIHMSASHPENHLSCEKLPPLAAEDHTCDVCALVYPEISIDDAVGVIVSLPGGVREAVCAVPVGARRVRPGPQVWSVTEYVCHLRDVYVTYTIRLHRTRTESRPVLEPMLNDLRARRFHYNDCDLKATVDELAVVAAGFCEEVARTGEQDWTRVATRLPGEQRTARWLVRQAMHEGVHHLTDIRTIGGAITETL